MELDVPLSPRGRGIFGWVPDSSAVYVDEREEVGRFLRLARPVRRGEAVLVEDPLFLSPADGEELEALISRTLDPQAVACAGAASSAASSACSTASHLADPSSSWLPVSAQLSLVVVQALLEDADSPSCEEFQQLRGDTERWAEQASRLWMQLREELRAQLSQQAMCEVYAIVAANAHATDSGRAGIYRLGSYAEHSCSPSAFKEVLIPVESASRPGSPCCSPPPSREGAASPCTTPPGSPGKSLPAAGLQPQLVVRAQKDLAEDDIVSLSYIPEYLPTWRRREQLQAGYGFLCTCERCERLPEVVCAFVCPRCGSGPCSPTAPVTTPGGGLGGHSLLCEACGLPTAEEHILEAFAQAEQCEVVSEDSTRVLHPYHHKIFGMYLHNLQAIPVESRVQALEQLMDAQRRLCGNLCHPLVGRLGEILASTHLEAGDHQQAVAGYRRAQELYALSHRGPPDTGHDLRCYNMLLKLSAGPLGAVPRRLSKLPTRTIARSPSLPSLAEDDAEDTLT